MSDTEARTANTAGKPLLDVSGLRTYFFTNLGVVRAVDGLSFQVPEQRIVGIVGESGCGKSVAARSILGIIPPPGRIVAGSIRFHGSATTTATRCTQASWTWPSSTRRARSSGRSAAGRSP